MYLKRIAITSTTIIVLATAFRSGPTGCITAAAQTPKFEVASIKPSAPESRGARCTGGPGTTDPSLLTCINYSLSFLVMMAYDLRNFQLVAPSWMEGARFDVTARVSADASRKEFGIMMQNLLAERFGLKIHYENREMAVFDLVVGKGGSKLKESDEPAAEKPEGPWKPPASGPPARVMAAVTRKNDSAADLAYLLSNFLGQPVTDATGLKGRYDYRFKFMMDPGGRAAGPAVSNGQDTEFGAGLIEALKDELGLRLERRKGQVSVLIVDHAEKVLISN